jgi:hypothetical protein
MASELSASAIASHPALQFLRTSKNFPSSSVWRIEFGNHRSPTPGNEIMIDVRFPARSLISRRNTFCDFAAMPPPRLGTTSFSASAMAAMCFGAVPQQPPIRRAPLFANSTAERAKYWGVVK